MERDPSVFVIGEDVAALGGLFQGHGRPARPLRGVPGARHADRGDGRSSVPASAPPSSGADLWSSCVRRLSRPRPGSVANHAAKSGTCLAARSACRWCCAPPSRAGSHGRAALPVARVVAHAQPGLVVVMPSTPTTRRGCWSRRSGRQSRRLPRAAPSLRPARAGAGGRVPGRSGSPRCGARLRRDWSPPRKRPARPRRAGRGSPPTGSERGDRSAVAGAARPGRDRRVGREDAPARRRERRRSSQRFRQRGRRARHRCCVGVYSTRDRSA